MYSKFILVLFLCFLPAILLCSSSNDEKKSVGLLSAVVTCLAGCVGLKVGVEASRGPSWVNNRWILGGGLCAAGTAWGLYNVMPLRIVRDAKIKFDQAHETATKVRNARQKGDRGETLSDWEQDEYNGMAGRELNLERDKESAKEEAKRAAKKGEDENAAFLQSLQLSLKAESRDADVFGEPFLLEETVALFEYEAADNAAQRVSPFWQAVESNSYILPVARAGTAGLFVGFVAKSIWHKVYSVDPT